MKLKTFARTAGASVCAISVAVTPLLAKTKICYPGMSYYLCKPPPPPPRTTPFGIDEVIPNHAEVRANQWVDTSTSLRGQRIHVAARVVNETGGLFKSPFNPIVTLSFRDAMGRELAKAVLNYSIAANQKEKFVNNDLPAVPYYFWTRSTNIVATAADSSNSSPPPPTWPIGPPASF